MTTNQKRAAKRLLDVSEELSKNFWNGMKIYKEPKMTTGVALSFPKLDKAIKLYKKHFDKN